MGWLTRATRSLENPNLSLTDPEAWEEAGLLTRSMSGVRVTPKRAIGYPPLWRGINLIANCARKLRPYVYRVTEDGSERDKSHVVYPLLRRKANRFIKAGILRQVLTYHAVLFGNGYALIVRNRLGQPVELLPLSPFDTFPLQAEGELWYPTIVAGERRRIPAADVLHIHGLSFDGLQGLSVIEVMCDALGLAISSRDYASRFFSQGANASGILMIPGHLKEDAIKNVIKDFDRIATGVTRQHRVGLLQDGVKWQPMTVNAQESQLLESRQFDAREVANILGLPPHKLGDGSRTSYNSLEMENQSYLDDSMDPWLVTWEEELEEKCLTKKEKESESHYIEFNRAALLRTDLRTRYAVYAQARQWGWMSVNEIRRKENEKPIGPEGDIYLQPGNMAPAGKLPASGGAPNPAPKSPEVPMDPPSDKNAERMRQAVEACCAAIKTRCERFHRIEVEQITAAAKRGKRNLIIWLDTFWAQNRDRIGTGLLSDFRIIDCIDGTDRAAERSAGLAAAHCEMRQRSLLESVTKSSEHELVRTVEAHLQMWGVDDLFARFKEVQ